MNAMKIFEPVVKLAWKVKGKAIRHAPELMLGTGLACMAGCVVVACKETTHVDEILDHTQERLDKVEEVKRLRDEGKLTETYGEREEREDLVNIYAHAAAKFVKLYAPAFALGVAGTALICGSYGIMKKRQVALTAAYSALQTGFSEYRRRVRDELGEEQDLYFKTGRKDGVAKIVNEEGKNDVVDGTLFKGDPGSPSGYARWFDESCKDYSKDPTHNLFFLKAQQDYCNHLLKVHGYLFLNDVYDLLGIPRCPQGQVIGWLRDNTCGGHGFVDFGIYNGYREMARDFVNGYEKSILLDFNIDPEPIVDYIGKC